LNSGETREFFNERTNRFDIRNDVEFDNQEDRVNFEEASSMVNDLFECRSKAWYKKTGSCREKRKND
jgi:hypothetical protein